ncbi:unnamed protein product [Linum tenue]|uniref:Uncharacterized protein n=1 Tax=Linum tenue TaxID=586396 RepID=A0AAV0NZY3_9ROSI|nr:unnamed protein product [Linum tenue]
MRARSILVRSSLISRRSGMQWRTSPPCLSMEAGQ